MYISTETLDDLMYEVIEGLLNRPFNVNASRGTMSEIVGVLLQLNNPRARISRTETRGTLTPFSALGELLWYLSKTSDLEFISYYISRYKEESEDGKTIYGGYGPRLFKLRGKYDQIENVLSVLKERPTSRKAVIQLFDGEDIVSPHSEIPCTCTLQFLIRDNKLHMVTYMRSNDAFIGLPHDIFAFTMLQEIIARTLNVDIGIYSHSVGSLHLYQCDEMRAKQFLSEGLQSTKKYMPEMPKGNPWESIATLLNVESKIRLKEKVDIQKLNLDSYWLDLVRLLQIVSLFKNNDIESIKKLKKEMANNTYNDYVDKRLLFRKTNKRRNNE